jgi:hypothetical protein
MTKHVSQDTGKMADILVLKGENHLRGQEENITFKAQRPLYVPPGLTFTVHLCV